MIKLNANFFWKFHGVVIGTLYNQISHCKTWNVDFIFFFTKGVARASEGWSRVVQGVGWSHVGLMLVCCWSDIGLMLV